MRPPEPPSSPLVSTVANPGAGSLADLVQPWVDALNDLSSSASNNLKLCNDSLTTFQNNCKVLVGDNTMTFQGLGAQAFENAYTLNEGHSMLVNAKIHDFYNASHNLVGEVQNLASQYELGTGIYYNDGSDNFPNPTIYDFVGSMDYDDILRVLMDGFLTTTSIDAILKPNSISGTISAGTQIGLNQMTKKIDANYQTMLDPLTTQRNQYSKGDNDYNYFQGRIDELNQRHQTAHLIVQGLTTNMNTQLETWAVALYGLAQQYLQEVLDAGQIDKPTISDYIYESTLPAYAGQNVLIWQLPNGGLFIMIKGGDPNADEQIIKNYLALYGQQGQTPNVTIMGYEGGMGTAQQIIDDSKNPNKFLDINIVNAYMVGDQNKLPNNQTPGVNYVDYSIPPEDQKSWSFLGLNGEQVVTMAVTAIVTLALDQPELLEGEFVAVFGKLGVEKMTEYAIALGFNASDSGGESAAQYLTQWTVNHNQDQIQVNGHWISMQAYVQQQISQGGTAPLSVNGVKHVFQYNYTVPDESNFNRNFNNSAYLGSQFVLDPTAMSKSTEGVVTVPPMTNLPPSS